jgi:hypothetical protein
MGWGIGSTLEGGGGFSRVTLDLTRVMEQESDFGMMCVAGRYASRQQYSHCRIILLVVNQCCLCKLNGESVNHLLLHCEVACSLWNAIFRRFGLS